MDPEIAAAFGGTDQPASSAVFSDPEISAAFAPSTSPTAPIGTLELAEDMGKGIIGGIVHQAGNLTDIATGTAPGPQSHASRWSAPFAVTDRLGQLDPDQQALAAKVNALYDRVFGTGPAAQTVKERIPQAAEAIGTVLGAGETAEGTVSAVGRNAAENEAATAIEEGHPLTEAAKAERASLENATATAKEQGLELPTTQISEPQKWANQSARIDLDLPGNSPVTPGMVDAAIKKKVETNYGPARSVPQYETGPQYEAALKAVDLTKLDPKTSAQLTNGSMNGAQAVTLSQELRDTARGLYEDAENRNQPFRARQVSRAEADANYNAAKAVETGLSEADPIAGQAYQEGRVYIAKANTWRNALDGAGNVIAPKLAKGLLRDEPFTGQMATVAKMAQMNPREFQSTRIPTPAPSLVRRGAAALAPAAGATIGGWVGGPVGAGLGEVAGRHLGERALDH